MKFKKGDRVRVWSLQSFSGGGFIKGEPAVVRQSQQENEDSVILAVVRKINGKYTLDKSYEVYSKQCELIGETQKKYLNIKLQEMNLKNIEMNF